MHLEELYTGARLNRDGKILSISFSKPHLVLSTSPANGGMRSGITTICNCQVSEPNNHGGYSPNNPDFGQLTALFSAKAGVAEKQTAFLFTAAHMNNAVWKKMKHNDLTIAAICTAGAAGNAVRAGDPASYYEEKGEYHPAGTINTMIAVNTPLTEGALCRAVMTATEAKTSILQELQIPSRYSAGPATGTGTDQIAVASLETGETALRDAGTHSKCGELIAKCVREALRGALELQDGLSALQRGRTGILLERFSINEDEAVRNIAQHLDGVVLEMLQNNFASIQRDYAFTAAVSSYIHIFDLIRWGMIPTAGRRESLYTAAAGIAAASAGDSRAYDLFLEENGTPENGAGNSHYFPVDEERIAVDQVLSLLYRAIAWGLKKRWEP